MEAWSTSGTPRLEVVRLLIALACLAGHAISTGDFSVAFMHTLLSEDFYAELPSEFTAGKGKIGKLKRALNGMQKAAELFQDYLKGLLVEKFGFTASVRNPFLVWKTEDKLG